MGENKESSSSLTPLSGAMMPAMVFLPNARQAQNFPPSLKLEASQDCDDGTANSPRNLWQVYALGGFMVARWIWARLKERNDNKRSPQDPSS